MMDEQAVEQWLASAKTQQASAPVSTDHTLHTAFQATTRSDVSKPSDLDPFLENVPSQTTHEDQEKPWNYWLMPRDDLERPIPAASPVTTHVVPPGAMALLRHWEKEQREISDYFDKQKGRPSTWVEPVYHNPNFEQVVLGDDNEQTKVKVCLTPVDFKSQLVQTKVAQYSEIHGPHETHEDTAPLALLVTLSNGATYCVSPNLQKELTRCFFDHAQGVRGLSMNEVATGEWRSLSIPDRTIVHRILRGRSGISRAGSTLNHDWLHAAVKKEEA